MTNKQFVKKTQHMIEMWRQEIQAINSRLHDAEAILYRDTPPPVQKSAEPAAPQLTEDAIASAVERGIQDTDPEVQKQHKIDALADEIFGKVSRAHRSRDSFGTNTDTDDAEIEAAVRKRLAEMGEDERREIMQRALAESVGGQLLGTHSGGLKMRIA